MGSQEVGESGSITVLYVEPELVNIDGICEPFERGFSLVEPYPLLTAGLIDPWWSGQVLPKIIRAPDQTPLLIGL